MTRLQSLPILFTVFLIFGVAAMVLAQAPPPKGKCGPDQVILYKRAVGLLDKAEKKLATGYTAEAKALVKEANSLFTILQKECGPEQKDRLLTEKETQQEAINQKLAADERSQADRLIQAAADKEKKSNQIEATQRDLSVKYQREAKQEYEQAHKRYIRSAIYALRNQQMLFRWLLTIK
jgi:uncharacterized protein (DUF1697 family)